MKPFEEQFSAWVDGQLNDAELQEFEKQLAAHPEAVADKESALKLGRFLREHATAPPLENPDFFNHQLMQRIAAESPRPVERGEKKRHFFFSIPGLVWAGAFCLLVSFTLFKTTIPSGHVVEKSDYFAQVVEAWPTSPNVSASTVYNPEDNVTVLWLDGLDYIPATYALK